MCHRGHDLSVVGRDKWQHCRACRREVQARYAATPAGAATRKRFFATPQGRAVHSRYNTSPKGAERSGRYSASAHGQLVRVRSKLQYRMRDKERRIAELEVALHAGS